ncbi:hypothetical protein ACW0US_17975 [Xanthomonas euvesicatoria]
MNGLQNPAYVAVDVDGTVLSCVAMRGERSVQLLDVSSVVELEGPNPAGLTVYESGSRRFVVRAQPWLAEPVTEGMAQRRIRHADAALRTGMCADQQPVVMVASMPLEAYFGAAADGGTEALEQELMDAVVRYPAPTAINFVRFKVVPRTVGAFMDWAFDDNGRPKEGCSSGRIVVVDVGLSATNVVAFHVATQEIDRSLMRTHEIGFATALTAAAAEISQKHDVEPPTGNALLSIGLAGEYRFRGEAYATSDLIEESLNGIAHWVAETINETASDARVLVVGVGARQLASALRKQGLECRNPENPEHANARGMRKFALLVWKEGL